MAKPIAKKRGVLIVNLGTPKSPQPKDVFHYLNEFLTDNRVMDIPWLKRQFLVRALIVPFRYKQSSELYKRLWLNEGSPLLYYGKLLKEKLQKELGENYRVSLGMRYQQPSIFEALEEIRNENVDELIILPLFPQYASATTGSVYQKIMEEMKNWINFPRLVFVNHFYDHPSFIKALCARAQQYELTSYDHILFSFHGLPERQIRNANQNKNCLTDQCCSQICSTNPHCYKAQCVATMKAVAFELNLNPDRYSICFQSRLGNDPWIQPYFSDVIHSYASKGLKRILVFCPSFVCDCLETTCEISYEYNKEFKKIGGEALDLVEGLNDHPLWIETMKNLILEHQSL